MPALPSHTHPPPVNQPPLRPSTASATPSRLPTGRYTLRDLSLARAGAAEGWLNEVLEIRESSDTLPGPLQGLARAGLGRAQLQAEGLVAEEVEKLYERLFVYSVGAQHSLQQSLARRPQAVAAAVALRWWRALVTIAERLLRRRRRRSERRGVMSTARREEL